MEQEVTLMEMLGAREARANRQQELLDAVGEEEQAVIRTFLKLKHGEAVDFEEMSGRLFRWARGWMGRD